MVLALAFALVAGAIAVKTTVSAQNNVPPVAEAGPDQAVQSISTTVHTGGFPNVTLDGSLSFDANGDSISYMWTLASISDLPACYTGNGWPTAGTGATITNPTSVTPTVNLSAATAGLFVIKLTVTDDGVSPDDMTAFDYVAVVAGNTWFVDLGGDNTWSGTKPAFDQGTIGPWRTITFAVNNALVKHGDRIMVGPNNTAGPSYNDPTYSTGGFGGNSFPENIDVNKWLTIWSTNGRNDTGVGNVNHATTINVAPQNGSTGTSLTDQVVKITWPFAQSAFSTTGLNAEKCGVVFGCTGHGFNLIGAPIGINAEGADAVYIHQNRVQQLTVIYPNTTINFWGIKLLDCKAPTVDDNIVLFDGDDDLASVIGIELQDCDETLPNLVWYNVIYTSGTAIGTLNVKGGAQVINNYISLAEQNMVEGIILTNCPKALVNLNTVHLTVKKCDNAYSLGIGLYGTDEDACNWSVVSNNGVILDVNGDISAIGIGIAVDSCLYVVVTTNDVFVNATVEDASSMGGLLGIGISMVSASFSRVVNNIVDVNNEVSGLNVVDGSVLIVGDGDGILDLSEAELDALQAALNDIFSDDYAPTVMYAASLAMGIYAYGSVGIVIGLPYSGNTIDVCSNVTLLAANFEDDLVNPLAETLKCAGSSLAYGIAAVASPGAYISSNDIVPSEAVSDEDGDTNGVHSFLDFIVTQYVPAPPQTPTPPVEALPDGIGKAGAIGILVFACPSCQVLDNIIIDVLAQADIALTGAEVEELTSWEDSVLGQIDAAIDDMICAAGEIATSPDVNLYDLVVEPFRGEGVNAVDFAPDAFVKGKGLVFGIGIATLESAGAIIDGNTVDDAESYIDSIIISETGTDDVLPNELDDSVVANGRYNLSLAIGILNYLCGMTNGPSLIATTVSNNLSIAKADADISVEAAQIVANSGNDAEAHGSGTSIGIGILVIGLEDEVGQSTIASFHGHEFTPPSDAIVTNNSASGDGLIDLETLGYNLVDEELAGADAFGAGLGGGIVVIGQMFPLISGNGDLNGDYVVTEEVPENDFVYGNGEAILRTDAVGLAQEDPDADGEALAIGVGIAAVFCLDPQIIDNCNFHKRVYPTPGGDPQVDGSEATPFDPDQPFVSGSANAVSYVNAHNQTILIGGQETVGFGGAYAAGVGILVADCEGAYVSQNHAQGTSNAYVDVLAIDEDPLELVTATALGASLACGIILVNVLVEESQLVVHLPYCIKESNTFEAGAVVSIPRCQATGDPLAVPVGLAAGIDAFIAVDTMENLQEPFDIQPVIYNYNDMPGLLLSSAYDGHTGYELPWTYWVDIGLLVVNLNAPYIDRVDEDIDLLLVDARYNYWGDPTDPIMYNSSGAINPEVTGPSGLGIGAGQPIVVAAECWTTWVCWQPWLTINHEWCLDSHVGKFGKAILLSKCWNSFSIPIALDEGVTVQVLDEDGDPVTGETAPYNTWEGFRSLYEHFRTAIGPAVYYDYDLGWQNVDPEHELQPMEGFKVYVKYCTAAIILASTKDSLPTLPVYEGWNLVGPNPPFCDPGLWSDDFVSSIVRTSGMDGFTQVVSQGSSQHNWSYTIGDWVQDEGDEFMQVGKAYWVYMNGDQTLAGFGFTRLPLYPEHFYH